MLAPQVSVTPRAIVPWVEFLIFPSWFWVFSTRVIISSACCFKNRPSSVSRMRRLPRMKRVTPSSSSKSCMLRLSGGWAIQSFSAALVMVPSRATVRKYFSVFTSIADTNLFDRISRWSRHVRGR